MIADLTGTHHVSALTARIADTREFYTRVLGLRPVIKTVNQDEPSMYHLFFGDGAGSPGSDITFFDLPHAARERRGNNRVSLTTFRVAGESALTYWAARLAEHGVSHRGVSRRDGRAVLDFEDSEGTQLSLVDDGGAGHSVPWAASTVPPALQIRGLGYVIVTVPELRPTHVFLTDALRLRRHHSYDVLDAPRFRTHVYCMDTDGPQAEVHVVVRDDLPRTRYGAGGVHHVALRVPNSDAPPDWVSRLNDLAYANSGVVDRYYFVSVYVREPNGILFELATDTPGFDVAGPLDGEKLSLPPFLEARRAEIESKLKPVASALGTGV